MDVEIDAILTKIEAVNAPRLTSDDYSERLARSMIEQAHHAIRSQDFTRAHEILDDLMFVFLGRGPGMVEVYEERPASVAS